MTLRLSSSLPNNPQFANGRVYAIKASGYSSNPSSAATGGLIFTARY
jgi:hypothetical protein